MTKYPELEQKKLISKEPGSGIEPGEKLSNKGAELKRRTGKTDQKDSVKERLKSVFSGSKTKADFFTALEKEQLSIYVHGNTIGILDKITERKHRLKTLGMLEEFHAVSDMIEKAETGKEEGKANTGEFRKERVNTGRYRQREQESTAKPAGETGTEKENGQATGYGTDGKKIGDAYSRRYSNEKPPADESFQDPGLEDERERELRKRKDALKKSRENESDYGNDYSKGK